MPSLGRCHPQTDHARSTIFPQRKHQNSFGVPSICKAAGFLQPHSEHTVLTCSGNAMGMLPCHLPPNRRIALAVKLSTSYCTVIASGASELAGSGKNLYAAPSTSGGDKWLREL